MYTIRALLAGEQGGVPGPEVYYQSHFDKHYTLAFYIWLIQGEGRTILVDTGMPADADTWTPRTRANKGPLSYWKTLAMPDKLLAEAGVRPEQVEHVILSTLGGYHAANVALFPHAQYHLSRRGGMEYVVPTPPWPRRKPGPIVSWLVGEAMDRVNLIDGEATIVPGVSAFETGGHHRGSLAIAVQTRLGKTMIVDSIFHYGNIEGGPVLGITQSLMDCYESYARVRREADIVLPGHDPAVLERYPGGLIG